MIFCTLFNGRYLAQGIALYRSLEATARGRFVLYVLCMDDMTADALVRLDLPNIRTIRLADFETDALRAARGNRSFGEYCWTCSAPLLMHVQELSGTEAVVAYVDADIRFFSDPQAIFDELNGRSIFVHEHGFAPAYRQFQATAGRFNVGVLAVRNNAEGRACLERWHRQSLTECVMDLAKGKCGDQTYLDEWPERYPGLAISENPGIGLAPWNVEKFALDGADGHLTVDHVPVVFYHYHSLRVWRPRFGLRPILIAQAPYAFGRPIVSSIYAPYFADLKRAIGDMRSVGVDADAPLDDIGIVRFLGNLGLGRLNLSVDKPVTKATMKANHVVSSEHRTGG